MSAYRRICLLFVGMSLMGQATPQVQSKAQAIKEKEALNQLKRAAESGDPKSMYLLGTKSSDPIEAKAWTRKSAESGYGLALAAIAYDQHYLRSIDKQRPSDERKQAAIAFRDELVSVFPKILDWANRGDLNSMYELGDGRYLQHGLLTREEKLNWLRRAAEGGHPIAIRRLGEVLLFNISDTAKAEGFQWIRKAAVGGDINAILEIARQYTHGLPAIGLAPDPDEAMKWINKAITLSGEPEGEFMSAHGLVDPYEAAKQRGENHRPKKEKPMAPPPAPTERK